MELLYRFPEYSRGMLEAPARQYVPWPPVTADIFDATVREHNEPRKFEDLVDRRQLLIGLEYDC